MIRSRPDSSPADTWIIDAGKGCDGVLRTASPSTTAPSTATILGYARLERYRQNFSHEMNTIPKDLADADAVFDRLRTVDVTASGALLK